MPYNLLTSNEGEDAELVSATNAVLQGKVLVPPKQRPMRQHSGQLKIVREASGGDNERQRK